MCLVQIGNQVLGNTSICMKCGNSICNIANQRESVGQGKRVFCVSFIEKSSQINILLMRRLNNQDWAERVVVGSLPWLIVPEGNPKKLNYIRMVAERFVCHDLE